MFKTKSEASGYLAGLIDGEGTVHYREYARGLSRQVQILNTDRDIIRACQAACDMLGIHHYIRERDRNGDHAIKTRKRLYLLIIGTRDGLEQLAATVNLRCAYKADNLRACLASYRAESLRPQALRLAGEGKSQHVIARELGVVQSNVHYWLTVPRKRRGRPRAMESV